MLHLLGGELCKEIPITANPKSLGGEIPHFKFFPIVHRVVRIANQLKPNVIPDTQTSGALGCHKFISVRDDLVPQKCKGDIVQLEVVQVVLSAHIQQKINPQPTSQSKVA